MLSEQAVHRVGRIDQVVRDYFANSSESEVAAKDLMTLFIEKKIFTSMESRSMT